MSRITVAGAGAFGTALAASLARDGRDVVLWARDARAAGAMGKTRENTRHLAGIVLPENLSITADADALATAETILVTVPTQKLRGFLNDHRPSLAGKICVLCCKGIETGTGLLPGQILREILPDSRIAILTGPGFAAEIARGLPTALTLATAPGEHGTALQQLLSTRSIRLYLSHDMTGAQLGGALKNVIAIACGISIGRNLGESARAALMTRGYAEMQRLAVALGARRETLAGLSGLGDLALTCTSEKSRNFSLGLTLGRGGRKQTGTTFEGAATAQASLTLAEPLEIELPIARIVADVLAHRCDIDAAVAALLSRPLRSEN